MFLSEPEWQAVLLSLKVSSLAVALSLPFGIFFSWLLVRRTFPGKALLDSILHLPLVLPPVVVGYLLLVAMGRRGFIGSWLYDWFGISFAFSWRGAVLEGVGYALADGMDVVHACGIKPQSITLIGGGARSAYWRQMLADISGLQLDYRTGGDVGPALGAARLAQLAVHDEADRPGLLKPLPLEQAHRPDDRRVAHYAPQRETFRQIYQQLKPLMS